MSKRNPLAPEIDSWRNFESSKTIHASKFSKSFPKSDWVDKTKKHLPDLYLDKFNCETLDNCRPYTWTDPTLDDL